MATNSGLPSFTLVIVKNMTLPATENRMKNPVVIFYEKVNDFLGTATYDIKLARGCRDMYFEHPGKISMFAGGDGTVLQQLEYLFKNQTSTVLRLALATAAFQDLAPWFTNNKKAREAFIELVIDEHKKDLFVLTLNIKREDGFVTGNVVASSASMLQGLLDVGDKFVGQTPAFVGNVHMIGSRFG